MRPCGERRCRRRGRRTSEARRPLTDRGTLYAGTSGFSYPGWTPRFYPAGLRPDRLLAHYATRLRAVELNTTFRARPTPSAIAGWVGATPPGFRFIVKAQRGASMRAMGATPEESIAWQLEPLGGFGERLGGVLFRVPGEVPRRGPESDARLGRVLAAWPRSVPLIVELEHASWHVDETFAALRAAGAVLCATELPEDPEPPTIRLTGASLYLRLRRNDYGPSELDEWAARISPFLDAGHDVYAFFRHDEVGRGAELALALQAVLQPSA